MSLIDRVKNILLTPAKEWDIIASERQDTRQVIMNYVLPLAGLAAAVSFIGFTFLDARNPFLHTEGMDWGIYFGTRLFISALIGIFASAIIIDVLSPHFGSEKDIDRTVQLVAYSYTPAWIGGLLAVFPYLSIIGNLFGFYSFYLLYLGLPKIKNTSHEKQLPFFLVSLLIILAVHLVVGSILNNLLAPALGLSTNYRI